MAELTTSTGARRSRASRWCAARPRCVAGRLSSHRTHSAFRPRRHELATRSIGNEHRARHDEPVRDRPRPHPGELHAAHPAHVHRARRRGLARPPLGHRRRAPLHLGRDVRALPPPRLGAREARHRGWGLRGGVRTEHSGDLRGQLRGTDARARCSTPSTSGSIRRPSRSSSGTARRRRCSPTASSRRWSRMRSPRMERPPLVIDVDDPRTPAESASARSSTRRSSKRGTPGSNGRVPTTNGAPSPSTTPRAPPGTRRASSTTTAARTSTRSRTSSAGTSRIIPSTCGPCRYSTATGGASRGRWRRSAGPASARARWRPPRSTRRSPAKG